MVDLILCVVAVVGIVCVLLPMLNRNRGGSRAMRISCMNNLRQIGVGFRLYVHDSGSYPQFNATNGLWEVFQTVGMEIGSPKVLACPSDRAKHSASDFGTNGLPSSFSFPTNRNRALSYFYVTNIAETNAGMFLSGDRNLHLPGLSLRNVLILTTNSSAQWNAEIHTNAGNVTLADGSAQQVANNRLGQLLKFEFSGVETQTLALPNR